jgi:predicted amidohydrolase YtcJ
VSPDAPDLLVTGTLYTLDPAHPEVEALLARGGRIVRVGTHLDCRREARPGAVHLDTRRGCAVPGLADAHGHVVLHARAMQELALGGVTDAAACVRLAAERARTLPPGAWVRGRGWDQHRWPGGALPDRALLDAAVPDHPVLLERVDGHAAWVNARALALAGIGDGTPDPIGGRVVRDARGRATGVLVDRAQDLVHERLPHPGVDELMRLLETGLTDLARRGLTCVHDAGCTSSMMRAYERLAESDRLPIRVYAMLDGGQAQGALAAELARWGARAELGLLEVRAVKLFADGALGSRGAALLEPYADDPGSRGLVLLEPGELRARVRLAARAGFQPAVHAIGDAACRAVLDAFEAVALDVGVARLRPRIEHFQIVRREDVPRLAAVGGVASMQPAHATSDAPWVEAKLGAGTRAARGAYAWRQVLDAGVPLAFGSDFPIESPDPRAGLFAAEARRPAGWERAWTPEERVSRDEALRAFTQGAAWASFAEGRRGALRAGMDADLTLFGADLLDADVDELPELPVSAAIVAGRVVFEAGR